jgi:hypothetical protein
LDRSIDLKLKDSNEIALVNISFPINYIVKLGFITVKKSGDLIEMKNIKSEDLIIIPKDEFDRKVHPNKYKARHEINNHLDLMLFYINDNLKDIRKINDYVDYVYRNLFQVLCGVIQFSESSSSLKIASFSLYTKINVFFSKYFNSNELSKKIDLLNKEFIDHVENIKKNVSAMQKLNNEPKMELSIISETQIPLEIIDRSSKSDLLILFGKFQDSFETLNETNDSITLSSSKMFSFDDKFAEIFNPEIKQIENNKNETF